jgi:hypothetical protein
MVEVKLFPRSKCLVIERVSFLAPLQLLTKSIELFQSKRFFHEKIVHVQKASSPILYWREIADPWRTIRSS